MDKLTAVRFSKWAFIIALFCSILPSERVEAQHFSKLPATWKFAPDSANVGLHEQWFAKDFDDSHWDSIKIGSIWELQGYDYDGYAWYRLRFRLPDYWGKDSVFVILGGVDDIYDLYLNGQFIASHGDLEKHVTVYATFTTTDLTAHINRAEENALAIRVYDWGGGGGVWKEPMAIVSQVKPFRPGDEFLRDFAVEHPEWALPWWAKKKGLAWTMVGIEDGIHEVLRSIDGSFGSTAWPFSVSAWVFESEANKLHAPELLDRSECSAFLKSGFLPISIHSYPAGRFSVESRLFVNSRDHIDEDAVSYCILSVESSGAVSSDAKLIVAIRPYLVNGHTGSIKSIRLDKASRVVTVNDSISILFDTSPEEFKTGILNTDGDISAVLDRPAQKASAEARSELGFAAAAVVLPIEFTESRRAWTTTIRIPLSVRKGTKELTGIRKHSALEEEKEVSQRWERRLKERAPKFHLPDKDYENAYYASLAYVLISMDRGMLHPGPLAYNYFWYRDAAYMTNALLQAGYADLVKPILEVFMKPQLPTGEFPSIFDLNYRGFGPHEWDAQGQALFALTQYYRHTRDKALVRRFWPNIVKAVDFVRKMRAERLTKEHEGTSVYGILPPSVSAEDLGPGSWHHYWDDFWCIKGLKDAAFLAGEIGRKDEEKAFQYEAEDLLRWTRNSYMTVMKDSLIDWIPNGPEDVRGTSMARGTSPALWPGQVLDASDPVVQTSFQRYYEKWIRPFGGAYLHQGAFWPYGFELAQCYTFLDRREITNEILRWHLDHQTYPGAYAWAEQIDTTSLWFSAGDMPHCWVAADYMNALRGLLLYELEDWIVLGPGVPADWLTGGKEIRVERAPSFFGSVSYAIRVSEDGARISLTLSGPARPPKGYVVRLPLAKSQVQKITADGFELSIAENGEFALAAETKQVLVELKK